MFGLGEGKKKKEGAAFVFDLEREMVDAGKYQELVKKIEKRVQLIKELLRKGADKKVYEEFGALLHAYASLLKVVGRIQKK